MASDHEGSIEEPATKARYVEVAVGLPRHTGKMIEVSRMGDLVAWANSEGRALYHSFYAFGKRGKSQIEKLGTLDHRIDATYYLSGVLGQHSVGVDIDMGGDDKLSLSVARDYARMLIDGYDVPKEAIRPFYSGQKGFHLTLSDMWGFAANVNPRQVRQTLLALFPKADAKPWIHSGLWRAPYSLHERSGYYKTPLALHELFDLTIEDIHELAREPRKGFQWLPLEDDDLYLASTIVTAPAFSEVDDGDHQGDPENTVTCVHRRYVHGVDEGERHDAMLAMASAWRRQGLPRSAVKRAIWPWAERSNQSAIRTIKPEEVEQVVNDVFDTPYEFGCDHPVMARYCAGPVCRFYSTKRFLGEVTTASDMLVAMETFYEQEDQMVSVTPRVLHDDISEAHVILGGYVVILMGDTGVNKSSLLLNLAVLWSDQKVLYLDLENPRIVTGRRLCQIASGLPRDDVAKAFRQGKGREMMQGFRHLEFMNVEPTLSSVERIVKERKPTVVIIDTMEDIFIQGKDGYGAQVEVMRAMRTLASETHAAFILVQHLSKEGGKVGKKGFVELDLSKGKGPSLFKQKADVVWGLEGKREGTLRRFRSLKTRDSPPFTVYLELDEATMQMHAWEKPEVDTITK